MKPLKYILTFAAGISLLSATSCAAQTNGQLLALSKNDHTLSIVDPSTLKVIAKIGLVLLTDLLGRRLPAVLCLRGVVLYAHLTDVQLRVARLAHVEAAKGELLHARASMRRTIGPKP